MASITKNTPIANLGDIVKAVKAKECILFLGAGVHYPPKDTDPVYGGCYPKAQQPPMGSGLATILAAASDLNADDNYSAEEKKAIAGNLQKVSLYYAIKDRGNMVNTVRAAVSDNKQPSRALRALADLDFPLVCTTNYDKLFEKALIQNGKDPIVSSYSNNPFAATKDYTSASLDPQKPFLFKIHGDVDDATNSIVITDEDYIGFILRMINGNGQNDPIPKAFKFYVSILPMLFIGFSLMDYNLRLLFKILGWEVKEAKRSYAVGPHPDCLIRKVYDPPVEFVVRDLWSFVPELYQQVKGKPMP